jgi:hypothetical protein
MSAGENMFFFLNTCNLISWTIVFILENDRLLLSNVCNFVVAFVAHKLYCI